MIHCLHWKGTLHYHDFSTTEEPKRAPLQCFCVYIHRVILHKVKYGPDNSELSQHINQRDLCHMLWTHFSELCRVK